MYLRKHFVVFLTAVCLIRASESLLPDNDDDDISEVSQCIMDIVDKNDIFQPTLAFFINEYHQKESFGVLNEMMDKFMQSYIPIASITNYSIFDETNALKYENFIIIYYIENCDGLINFSDMRNTRMKFLVILKEEIIFDCYATFIESARNVAANDITFIHKDKEKSDIKVVTCIPTINPKTCKPDNNVKLTQIGACKNGLIIKENKDIFPNKKPSDWMQCPLNVGMGALYPYSKEYNDSLQNLDILNDPQGSDVEIIKIVANHFNASLRFYHIKIVAENVLLDLSFLPFILNGTLDVCAGGLYRLFGDVVSYSGIYSRQTVIWIYTVERENRSWSTFIQKIGGLYIFVIFYLFYSFIWTLIAYFDDDVVTFTNTLFYAYGAMIGTASLQDARTLKQKIVNLFYLLLCLHLSAYISIQLFSFLTIQGPPYVYKQTNELYTSGKPLYLKDQAKYFIDDDKYLAFANTSYNCDDFIDCVTKTQRNKGITLIIDGLFANVQTETAISYEATILRAIEPMLVVYHEMLIRKDSTLVGNFEKVMQRLFEAGICDRLFEEAIGVTVISRARSANQNMMSNSYSCEVGCEITMSQCAGAFYLWITGCIISCFVFFVELFIKRRKINYSI